jgi:hypothetical protein
MKIDKVFKIWFLHCYPSLIFRSLQIPNLLACQATVFISCKHYQWILRALFSIHSCFTLSRTYIQFSNHKSLAHLQCTRKSMNNWCTMVVLSKFHVSIINTSDKQVGKVIRVLHEIFSYFSSFIPTATKATHQCIINVTLNFWWPPPIG